MTDKNADINRRIKRYGGDIINSEDFKRMFSQRHHLKDSLGRHTVSTARMSLKICDFLNRRGISVDEEKVVRIALLHDLGMLDRNERYKNNYECGRLHPGNSAEAAKKLWPNIDDESLDAIKSHMWPLSLSVPKTKEAFILCLADKLATMKDIV